jgi:hypothetical protein
MCSSRVFVDLTLLLLIVVVVVVVVLVVVVLVAVVRCATLLHNGEIRLQIG